MSVEPSAKQIGKALLSYAEEHLGWDSYSAYMDSFGDLRGKVHDISGIGPVKIFDYHDVDQDKTYDGWSEDIWIVFEISGRLYRAKGKYTSYIGSEWSDELKEVKPAQKIVTVYEEA